MENKYEVKITVSGYLIAALCYPIRKEAMAQIIVEGAPRATRGKNEARRLRVSGKVPATLYGGKGEVLALAVNTKPVTAILRPETRANTPFPVDLGLRH